MMHGSKLAIPVAIVLGALGGWLAASGQLSALVRARAAATPGCQKEEGDCCGGADRQQFVAAAAREGKDGKKPNILFIMGDDVGVWAIGPGSDAVRGNVEQNAIFHLLLQANPRLRAALCAKGDCDPNGVPVELPNPRDFESRP